MSAVESWLREVHEEKGSDLFVTAGAPPCIKVNGKIRAISTEVLLPEEADEIVRSVMGDRQEKEFEDTNECQFAIALEGEVRFRISAFSQQGNTGMVCRRIETRIPTFDGLP
jgi:twitching motility protein PilU